MSINVKEIIMRKTNWEDDMFNKIPLQSNDSYAAIIIKEVFSFLILLAIYAVALFLSAGRIDWIGGWIFLATSWVCCQIFVILTIGIKNTELVKERSRVHKNTKSWDKFIVIGFMILFLIICIIGGLDNRFGWTDLMSLNWKIAGIFLALLGWALTWWAICTNNYFASNVRIQKDRGQKVVTTGPYKYVRHPSYSSVFALIGTISILNSWRIFIPIILIWAVFIIRTELEDKTLQKELPGYKKYTQKTCYKLIPYVY